MYDILQGRLDYDADGKSYYDGEWVNGIKHGWGTRQYASGNIYHGMWFNNVRHGEGTMKWLNMDQVYIGQWENGIQVNTQEVRVYKLIMKLIMY